MAKTSSKKRKVIVDATGEAHITASFNNIIVSLTNKNGDGNSQNYFPVKIEKEYSGKKEHYAYPLQHTRESDFCKVLNKRKRDCKCPQK